MEHISEKDKAMRRQHGSGSVSDWGTPASGLTPKWLVNLKKDAISKFETSGFPVRRRGNERWKYTDVTPIISQSFEVASSDDEASGFSRQDLKNLGLDKLSAYLFVFVDGFFRENLSSLTNLPRSVTIGKIDQIPFGGEEPLGEYFGKHVDYVTDAFCALNTAFFDHGAFVRLPDGTHLDKPLHFVFLSGKQNWRVVSYPRLLLVIGKNCSVSVVETYASEAKNEGFCNSVVEIEIGSGSSMAYGRVQKHGPDFFHISTTQIHQEEDSFLSRVALDLGGKLTRNNVNVVLAGERATCNLNGFYAVSSSSHVDNNISIDHAKPNTKSRETYKGVLSGDSRAVFQGNILVRKGANKSDARQDDKNLLLSDQAEVNTSPSLQIYADDVKCGHGATSGTVDERMLFYMQSRGLSLDMARQLVVMGFSADVINSMKQQAVRTYLDDSVLATLEEF